MRIVIDLQGAQTASRYRGIGRYSLSLAVAMARNAGEHEIHVLLNGRFADTVEPIRQAFGSALPEGRIHVWMPARSTGQMGEDGIDERIRESVLNALEPDFVHIASLFEGFDEAAITGVHSGFCRFRTAVTLFDLIPLIHQKRYLENPVMAQWYHRKVAHMRRADLLLGISGSASQEAIDYLGFEADKVVNISSAIDDGFKRLAPDALDEAGLRRKYGLSRAFVMCTGGIDHRKNIEGLIRSYAMLPQEVRSAHQLAVVCSVRDDSRDQLNRLARDCGLRDGELVLTGFVSDEDLVALYNLARLFVFPSWHEGFGLPALEAMQCGAPVIGSATSSLPEVIGLEEALFDPHDDQAIKAKLLQGLVDDAFRERLLAHAPVQAKRFSWDASAVRALAAMASAATQPPDRARPRLAYVSPLPPERSGIADYSAELIPELARHYEIDVIVDQSQIDDHAVCGSARVRDLAWFQVHGAGYDRVLYHFGNSAFHVHMVDMLERVPGVVVLHDFFLSGMLAYREHAMGRAGTWAEALYRSHGYAPMPALAAHKHEQLVMGYPCNYGVLASAVGMLVHSAVSTRMAQQYYPGGDAVRWREVPLMRVAAQAGDRARLRQALGLPKDAFVVCSFGFMAPTKLNSRLVDAWLASSMAEDENCYLVFVGEPDSNDYGSALQKKILASSAAQRIRITGFASRDDFRAYLQCADAAVQLRTMSRGETSAAVLDALNHGLATVVNANGSMADLPDHTVLKLEDAFEDAALQHALESLYHDVERRQELALAGQRHVHQIHQPRRCADAYADAIEDFYAASGQGQQALLTELGGYLAHGGAAVDEAGLGQALAWNHPSRQSGRQALIDIDPGAGLLESPGGRAALQSLLLNPPAGWRIEPVSRKGGDSYRYARGAALELLGCPASLLRDEPVDVRAGDVLLGEGIEGSMAFQQLLWRGARFVPWSEHAGLFAPQGPGG